jgi:hypothetical protein
MFDKIIPLLQQVASDRTVPRNVRSKVENSIKVLQDSKEDIRVRIGTVIADLDEVANDPNIPMYTRTQVWNIVTALEAMRQQQ